MVKVHRILEEFEDISLLPKEVSDISVPEDSRNYAYDMWIDHSIVFVYTNKSKTKGNGYKFTNMHDAIMDKESDTFCDEMRKVYMEYVDKQMIDIFELTEE